METRLNITLAHEFYRCAKAYKNFNFLKIRLSKDSDIESRLNCYDYYVDFLAHLYEFNVGIIEFNINSKNEKPNNIYIPESIKRKHEILDFIITSELEKLLRNRKRRIEKGYIDDLGLDIKFYENKVPEEFGKHFRFVRHRRNHTDPDRAESNGNISLTNFFRLYHIYLMIMFQETEWLWKVEINNFDWKEINSFTKEIL